MQIKTDVLSHNMFLSIVGSALSTYVNVWKVAVLPPRTHSPASFDHSLFQVTQLRRYAVFPVSTKQDRKHGNDDCVKPEYGRHTSSGPPGILLILRQQIVLRPRRDTDRRGSSHLAHQLDHPRHLRTQRCDGWDSCQSHLRHHCE